MSEPAGVERLVGADRVIAVLKALAEHPLGASLDELSVAVDSPKPTVHRALATLRRAGFADLVERGVYVLGDEFVRLAAANLEARPDTARMQPLLDELAATFGETAHYAVLDGAEVIYRAKADPPSGAVRLTSAVGGRNPAHRTAVGKLLLSGVLPDRDAVAAWLGDRSLERTTANTIVTADALADDLAATRSRGFGIDDQENELGVNCVAVPIRSPGSEVPTGAVSVSAVAFRTPLEALVGAVPRIRSIIASHLGPRALA